jgi:hypothetical protein
VSRDRSKERKNMCMEKKRKGKERKEKKRKERKERRRKGKKDMKRDESSEG